MPPDKPEGQILDTIQYFNIVLNSIQGINNAIMQGKDPLDASENLISDLPESWKLEIINKLDTEKITLGKITNVMESKLQRGNTQSTKDRARLNIYNAKMTYARNVKQIIISLLKEKDLLFHSRKPIEQGYHAFPKEMFEEYGGFEEE